ncbi:hypothetical protein LXL04_005835 [Taraxacum kok-saghyz]
MNLTALDYKGFSSDTKKLSSYESTNVTVNKIFKKSNTRFRPSSTTTITTTTTNTTTNRSCKVRCELGESIDEFHEKSWRSPEGVVRCSANYVPLSPISFLERAADVYRDRTSVIYGRIKYTWEETHRRCLKLASVLINLGVSRGDVVAVLAPNVPAMLELHFAVPMAGAVICPLNKRLDPNMISNLLEHSESKILFVDCQLLHVAEEPVGILKKMDLESPIVVVISEPDFTPTGKYDYESLVESGVTEFSIIRPINECDPISLNYTSGTTSRPKGVICSHRGAYLSAVSSVFIRDMRETQSPTYLWTLPMFHCNGWCFTWGVAVVAGTNICLRRCDPKDIFNNIVLHNVTHMDGAPAVLNMIVNSPVTDRKPLPHNVKIVTGGAPPPPTVISKMEEMGFRVSHIYGLSETYGPGTLSSWRPEWERLNLEEQVKLKSRQGVKVLVMEEVVVKDPVTMESVKRDGKSIGEVMFRGNMVMNGYYKDLKATKEGFEKGWFEVEIWR